MTAYTFSLRLVRDGRFLSSLSPVGARSKPLDDLTWAVYVEKNGGRPYRVHGWTDEGTPLVRSEHDKQLLPL